MTMQSWKKSDFIARRKYVEENLEKVDSNFVANPLYKEIYNQVYKKNSNVNMLITGRSGAGKSYVACKIADMFDNDFKIDEQVFTDGDKYIQYISDLLKVFQDKHGKFSRKKFKQYRQYFRGKVLWLDEGVLVGNSRDYWTQSQRNMQELWNIFRFLGMITIVCVPSMNQFFKDGLEMMHFNIQVDGYRRGKNICRIYRDFKYNKRGRLTRRFFWAKLKSGNKKKLHRMRIRKTENAELLKEYELLSAELKFNALNSMVEKENQTKDSAEEKIVRKMSSDGKSGNEIARLTGITRYRVGVILKTI